MLYKLVPNNKALSPDKYWMKRLYTLALAGNGAAVVLLGSFIKNNPAQASPIIGLQNDIDYFVPFILGLLFCAVCAYHAAFSESYIEAIKKMEKDGKEILAVKEMQITEENIKLKHDLIKIHEIHNARLRSFSDNAALIAPMILMSIKKFVVGLSFAYIFFVIGLIHLSGFLNFVTEIEFTLQTYSHG